MRASWRALTWNADDQAAEQPSELADTDNKSIITSLKESFCRSHKTGRRNFLRRRNKTPVNDAGTGFNSTQWNVLNQSSSSIETTDGYSHNYIMQGPIAINQRLKSAAGIRDTFDHRANHGSGGSANTSLPDYKENDCPFAEPQEPTRQACENLYGALQSKKIRSLTQPTVKPKPDPLFINRLR